MPMPHRTQMQLIKRRLTGKEGSERLRELRQILEDLPDYRNGPYGDIRKGVMGEIEQTRLRSRVVQRDAIAVRREGAAQIALTGAPNAGKSSLLHALSHVQIAIGDYAFTTLRPVPALTRIGGVLLQLVEIPGLIAGGRALLGVLREADAIVYCQDAGVAPDALAAVRAEVATAGIGRPALLAATKLDEADAGALARLRAAVPELPVVGVSVLDDASLEALKAAIWALTGLIRVYLCRDGRKEAEPLALRPGATIGDVAAAIHSELNATLRGARVWGPSARFAGQLVGREHRVCDGDAVEVVAGNR